MIILVSGVVLVVSSWGIFPVDVLGENFTFEAPGEMDLVLSRFLEVLVEGFGEKLLKKATVDPGGEVCLLLARLFVLLVKT